MGTSIGTWDSELKWIELLNESVHTSDDQDIGDIEAINKEFVVVKRGFVNVHRYYIPTDKIDGWDGNVLWLKITEEQVKQKYQNDDTVPDPSRYLIKDYENFYRYAVYYLKDFPGYAATYPEVEAILPKYSRPAYTAKNTTREEFHVNLCELCRTAFDTEDDLSNHVRTSH